MQEATTAQAPVVANPAPTAAQMYEAQRNMRSELRNQLSRQQSLRSDLRRELDRVDEGSPARAGVEARLKEVDTRISALDQQLAAADQAVARAAAVPNAIVPPAPPPRRSGPPDEVWVMGGMFIIFVMMPLAVGYARRMWKRSATAIAELPKEWAERFTRLEQAVDAVAIELERVGEGQRYVTNLMTEGQRSLGPGAASPIELREREAIQQGRR